MKGTEMLRMPLLFLLLVIPASAALSADAKADKKPVQEKKEKGSNTAEGVLEVLYMAMVTPPPGTGYRVGETEVDFVKDKVKADLSKFHDKKVRVQGRWEKREFFNGPREVLIVEKIELKK